MNLTPKEKKECLIEYQFFGLPFYTSFPKATHSTNVAICLFVLNNFTQGSQSWLKLFFAAEQHADNIKQVSV